MSGPLQAILRLGSGHEIRVQSLGKGPALVMCHESPRSSSALLPLAKRISDRFTCVMVDTPGFGLSDALNMARPEIPDFAGLLLDVTEALGLDRVPYYGTHTGAAIAVDAAVQAPDRISAAILDGYAIFTAEERDRLLASYLPAFRPALDGGLAAWLWARVRDQFTAFPWNQVGDGSKLGFGPPSLEAMQRVVDDFLLAGDHYRAGYSAAFRYDHFAPLKKTDRPLHIVTREDDLLFAHMERARGAGDHVHLHPLSPDRDAWGEKIAALAQAHAGGELLDQQEIIRRAAAHPGRRRIAMSSAGPVVTRIDGAGPTIVLLHDVPGGMADLDHVAERLARTCRVVRVNLPGLGASRLADGAAGTLQNLTAGVAEALEAAEANDVPVVAFGASLPVALALDNAARVIAVDPWPQIAPDAADHVPDLTPGWDGSHLMAAFWWARDYEIYKPWYNRVNTELRALGNERDTMRIHHRFRANVLSGNRGTDIARMLYRCDCSDGIKARGAQVLVYDSDPDADRLQGWAARQLDRENVRRVPRAAEDLVPVLARLVA